MNWLHLRTQKKKMCTAQKNPYPKNLINKTNWSCAATVYIVFNLTSIVSFTYTQNLASTCTCNRKLTFTPTLSFIQDWITQRYRNWIVIQWLLHIIVRKVRQTFIKDRLKISLYTWMFLTVNNSVKVWLLLNTYKPKINLCSSIAICTYKWKY